MAPLRRTERRHPTELPLTARRSIGHRQGAITVFPLMDKQQTDRFESLCREVGARFSGGVFACVALADTN